MTKLGSCLRLSSHFRRFVVNFVHVAALLNQKIRKDQLQSFEGSNYNVTTSLMTLKANLVEPRCWHFQGHKATMQWIWTHAINRWARSCYRRSLPEQANQLDIGVVH